MLAPSKRYLGRLEATKINAERRRQETADLADEARYLLATQGTGYVLRALGYDNPESLARRMRRHGYVDVAVIFEEMTHVRAA